MAEPDYSLPPWITAPGAQYAATIQRSRQLSNEEANSKVQRAVTEAQEARDKAAFALKQQQMEQQIKQTADTYVQQQALRKKLEAIEKMPAGPEQTRALNMALIESGAKGVGAGSVGTAAKGMQQPPSPAMLPNPGGPSIPYLNTPGQRPSFPPASAFPKQQPPAPVAPTSIKPIPIEGDPDSYGVVNPRTGAIQIRKKPKASASFSDNPEYKEILADEKNATKELDDADKAILAATTPKGKEAGLQAKTEATRKLNALRDRKRNIEGGAAASPAGNVPATPKEVIRETKDGKKAAFDPDSKKFLHYVE